MDSQPPFYVHAGTGPAVRVETWRDAALDVADLVRKGERVRITRDGHGDTVWDSDWRVAVPSWAPPAGRDARDGVQT